MVERLRFLNGFPMFVGQAAGQLEFWCGCGDITVEIELILSEILK